MKYKSNNTRGFILILVLLAGLCLYAAASAETLSGSCGPNATWTLDDSGKLTISGSGEMTSNPWSNYKDSIKSIVIGNGITNIISEAFQECSNLKNADIPSSVKTIGNSAFQNCTSLSSVIIPGSVTSMGSQAFSMCTRLSSIVIPRSVVNLGDWTFAGCSSLKNITINSNTNNISFGSMFYSCPNLAAVNISSDNTTYSSKDGVAFDKAGKTLWYCPPAKKGTYSVPAGVTKIYSFSNCKHLTSIILPASVNFINNGAFFSCSSLTSIIIPEGVKAIPDYCFENCINLQKISLPHSLEKIGIEAFYISSLTQVTLHGNLKEIGESAFDFDVAIAAPEGSYAAQWARDNGHNLTIIEPEYTVTFQYANDQGTVSASPAYGKKGTKVTLKASPKKGFLFSGWSVVSGGVKIENNQFKIGTSDVVIKAKFKKDPSYACVKGAEYKLNTKKKTAKYLNPTSKTKTSITIPATITVDGVKYQVTEIASNAFKGCSKLKKVTIGKNITRIGKNAFKDCKKLATITIKTTKLTKKGIGSSSFKNIASKPTFKCPKKQKNNYKTWILKTGKAPKKSKFK